MNRNKKLANMAMLVALAMIFSYVESLIPINFGVPGMKLGVANLVTVTGLYFLKTPEVLAVSVLRVLLTGFILEMECRSFTVWQGRLSAFLRWHL